MKNGHGSSRRQAYGRRMKDLRTRRGADPDVDLDGPAGWTRGAGWDDESALQLLVHGLCDLAPRVASRRATA